MESKTISDWVVDARQCTLDLVADLDDAQIMGPQLDIINPLLWEIGHVAWFTEKWILRDTLGRDPIVTQADDLWDSIAIAHDIRWDLPLLSRAETLQYLIDVRDEIVDALQGDVSAERLYKTRYCVHHEDMHTEAFTYTRQTLGYPPPSFQAVNATGDEVAGTTATGDVEITQYLFQVLGMNQRAHLSGRI